MRHGWLAAWCSIVISLPIAPAQPDIEYTPAPERTAEEEPADDRPWFIDQDRPGNRHWARAEYLLWHLDDAPATPDANDGLFSGGRLALGWWADPEQIFGLEASGFFLSEREQTDLWGFEGSMTSNAYRSKQTDAYLFYGVTYEDLLDSRASPTRNQFYGGHVGARAQFRRGCWHLEVNGKLAMGLTHQTQNIAGSTIFAGHHDQDRFTVMPEVQVRVGYQLSQGLLIHAGYDATYWSNVTRTPAIPFATSDFWAHGLLFGAELRY